jgi:hypothetical protein
MIYANFLLNFLYSGHNQRSDVTIAGSKYSAFISTTYFATQKDGKTENMYCTLVSMKKGIGSPNITSPDIFATAMPSTLLCDNENSSSDRVILMTHINMHVIINIPKDQIVRENQFRSSTDAIKAINAGNTSLEII